MISMRRAAEDGYRWMPTDRLSLFWVRNAHSDVGSGCVVRHYSHQSSASSRVYAHQLGKVTLNMFQRERRHIIPPTFRRGEIRLLFPSCCAQAANPYRCCVHAIQRVYVTSLTEIPQRSVFSSPIANRDTSQCANPRVRSA